VVHLIPSFVRVWRNKATSVASAKVPPHYYWN
jgi:hypothetical protein